MKKLAAVVATAVAVLGLAGVTTHSATPTHTVAMPCCKVAQ